MKILLLEPDRLLASNYKQALQNAGHEVECQHNAQAAIHALEDFPAELIILELQLPSHNGVEFLYELRSYSEWQNIPAMILSFVPLEEITTSPHVLEQLGVSGYLYKPQTKLRNLIHMVGQVLQPAV